jgi:propionate CoA-transferase
MAELITAKEAAEMVQDGDAVICATFGASGVPEDIYMEIEKRFKETGHPRSITYTHAAGSGSFAALGDGTYCRGEDHIAHTGLIKRWIASHSACSDFTAKQIVENQFAAWCLPLGTMIHMWREQARGLKGCLSKVGLNTYVDPRFEGGAINQMAKDLIAEGETYVEYIPDFRGEEFLFYKGLDLDVALLRGTKMDKHGNMSIEKEPYNFESLTIAQAVKACGGKVIVQVEEIVEVGEIHPKLVKVPGIYIDYVVIEKDPSKKVSTVGGLYNPAFTGETRIDVSENSADVMPLGGNKIICRRAAMEVQQGMMGNFGLGMPQSVGSILAEEGVSDYVTMLSESGSIGGVPASGVNFGAHYNIEASCDQGDHFNFFDAGGLDFAGFGLSEVGPDGGMNVAVLNGAVKGVGGFMNIAAGAKKIVVLGTFTAAGIKTSIVDGKLVIDKEGKFKKFIDHIELNAFDAKGVIKKGGSVTYITERAVFEMSLDGLVLTEIAPGIDLQTQVLDQMEFKPIIPEGGPKLMPAEIFQENWGGLKAILDAKGPLKK